MRARSVAVAAALVSLAGLTGCSGSDEPADDGAADSAAQPVDTSASPTSIFTLTPAPPAPEPPPSGQLIADMRQSSRDAAANRFEVWVDNDTDAAITPTRITYRDGRYRRPLAATRLREIPSQSERGFQITQPDRPACDSDATSGEITVDYLLDGEPTSVTVPVEDETDVAGRYASSRCLVLAVAQVATLSWADVVPVQGAAGKGQVGTLTLQVETTGRPGPTLTIDTVRGTPILNAAGDTWAPGLTITGTDPSTAVPLPVKPTRCDAHAFSESGGATAFIVNLHLDGEAGSIVLRMRTEGARNAITFAEDSCGELTGPR